MDLNKKPFVPPDEDRSTSKTCRCCLWTRRTQTRTATPEIEKMSFEILFHMCKNTVFSLIHQIVVRSSEISLTLSFVVAITRAFGNRMAVLVFLMFLMDTTGMATWDTEQFDPSYQLWNQRKRFTHLQAGVTVRQHGSEAEASCSLTSVSFNHHHLYTLTAITFSA